MLSFKEAQTRCLNISLRSLETHLPLEETFGRYLSSEVYTKQMLPYWDNSAMDGYAIRHTDVSSVPTSLQIVETIPAGYSPSNPLLKGQSARIMTGAPLPQGADTVVIQENTTRISDTHVEIHSIPSLGANVRMEGEELRSGAKIANRGDPINIGLVGLAAARLRVAAERGSPGELDQRRTGIPGPVRHPPV